MVTVQNLQPSIIADAVWCYAPPMLRNGDKAAKATTASAILHEVTPHAENKKILWKFSCKLDK